MLWIRLLTLFKGKFVGKDFFGNKYYRMKGPSTLKERRWVIYRGLPEPSKIPACWFEWLHHTVYDPPSDKTAKKWFWEKNHLPNLTGTSYAYLPSLRSEGTKSITEKGYEAWQPRKGKNENKFT